MLLIVSSIHLALYSVRNIPLAAIAVAPIVALNLSALLNAFADRSDVRSWLRRAIQGIMNFSNSMAGLERKFVGHWLPVLLTLLAVFTCITRGWFFGRKMLAAEFASYKYPIAVSQFIAANQPQGRVFNTYDWGGVLIYYLYP